MVNSNNQIQEIALKDALQIRHSVLQFAESTESSILPGDKDARTRHFGFFVNINLVGVASLFVESLIDRPGEGYRLRAMAVDPSMQRKGVGTALIKAIIYAASVAKADYLWCTARQNAIGFYTGFGFQKDNIQIEMPHGTFSQMILTF